jgi:prepilin-type N-terminal cleavage/methylation domain-containing protein
MRNRGFTLIELIVVILVILILSSVVISIFKLLTPNRSTPPTLGPRPGNVQSVSFHPVA